MKELTMFPADVALQPLIINIAVGSDERLEEQLIAKSRQPNILKYTPKDATSRFKDKETLERWRSGGRELHWLLGTGDDLAGVIWYGKKSFPLPLDLPETPTETFAIRIYDGYQGHGLAVPAMRQSLAIHVTLQEEGGEELTGIWLETDADNPAALAVYTKFGYEEVFRDSERVTMMLSASRIRTLLQQ